MFSDSLCNRAPLRVYKPLAEPRKVPPSTLVTMSDLCKGREYLPQVNRGGRRQGAFYFQCKVAGLVTLRAAFKVMSKASLLLWSLATWTPVGEGPEQPFLLRFLGKQTQAKNSPKNRRRAVGYMMWSVRQCWLFRDSSFRGELPILGKSQLCHLLSF